MTDVSSFWLAIALAPSAPRVCPQNLAMGLLPRVPDMAAWFFKANRRLFSSSLLKWCFMPKIHIIFCHILYCLEEVTGPPVLQLNRSYKKMTHWASSQVCLPCWPNEHHHNFMTKLHDVSTWKLNTYYFIYFPHSCKIFLYKSMHIQIISDILKAFLCQSFFYLFEYKYY